MPKVSWLDSVRMESSIHIAREGDIFTLCGHSFDICFRDDVWVPYRVSSKRPTCKKCMILAIAAKISKKGWLSIVPERDYTDLPASTKVTQALKPK